MCSNITHIFPATAFLLIYVGVFFPVTQITRDYYLTSVFQWYLRCSACTWCKNAQIRHFDAWLKFRFYRLLVQFLYKSNSTGEPIGTLLLLFERRLMQNIKTWVNEEFNVLQADVFIFCIKGLSNNNKKVPIGCLDDKYFTKYLNARFLLAPTSL